MLVATGAEFVVVAVVAVTLAVAILFLLDNRLHHWANTARLRRRRVEELQAELHQHEEAEKEAVAEAHSKFDALSGARAQLERAELEVDQTAETPSADPKSLLENFESAREGFDAAAKLVGESQLEVREATNKAIEASKPERTERIRTAAVGGLVSVVALVCALLIDLGHGALPFFWGWVAVIGVSVLAGAIGVTLYTKAEAASAEGETDRAQAEPQVEPIALLQANGTPLVGFFVAETADRVFVGTFEQRAPVECTKRPERCANIEPVERVAVPPRMLSLPRDEIQNLSIGPRLPLNAKDAEDATERGRPRTAREWAAGTALILCEEATKAAVTEQPVGEAGSPDPTTETSAPTANLGCSPETIVDLQAFAAAEQAAIKRTRDD